MNRDKFGEQLALDSQISRAGKNLSVGQRQMIALARAMVRRSRLLILDEGEFFWTLLYFPSLTGGLWYLQQHLQ
jgi:ABC-type molybdenum transport system ATPase subunit/photorepair protein PhrA